MHIVEVAWRNRNDFGFTAQCRHCKQLSKWSDGYADAFYQNNVFPARHCPDCGLNEAGETEPPILPAAPSPLSTQEAGT